MPEQPIITMQFPDGRTQRYVGPHAEQVAAKAEARGAVRIDQGQPEVAAATTLVPAPIVEDAPEPVTPVDAEERPASFTVRQPRVRRDPASGDVIAVEETD